MKNNKMITNLVLIIFGVLIVAWPNGTAEMMSKLFGLAILIYGVFNIIQFFMKKESKSTTKLIYSAVLVVVGILILTNVSAVIAIVPIIIGVYVALTGALNAIIALRNREADTFKRDIILSVVTFALGVIIFANPFSTARGLMILVGLTLVYIGVSGLIIRD